MYPAGLEQFNVDGYSVEMIGAEHSPGFELTTGSFGQAISQAGGIALARRLKGYTGRTFVFMSDGELAMQLSQLNQPIASLDQAVLQRMVAFANACGALAATQVGAISA